jgi:hypothetical protein
MMKFRGSLKALAENISGVAKSNLSRPALKSRRFPVRSPAELLKKLKSPCRPPLKPD